MPYILILDIVGLTVCGTGIVLAVFSTVVGIKNVVQSFR
jgi:hypothetical protein